MDWKHGSEWVENPRGNGLVPVQRCENCANWNPKNDGVYGSCPIWAESEARWDGWCRGAWVDREEK